MRIFVIGIVVLALWSMHATAQAQRVNECKECRDDYRACQRAHSELACGTNYNICLNHCRKK
jgi:hypothetical protein